MIVLRATSPSPAVWFAYSPDRKGEHPERHLREFRGTLQADAYAGFNQLYSTGRIQEAACWAHVRRKFYELDQAHASPIAKEAMLRIGHTLRDRARDPWPATGRTAPSPPTPFETAARVTTRVVGKLFVEVIAEVRLDGGNPLCAHALGSVDALLR